MKSRWDKRSRGQVRSVANDFWARPGSTGNPIATTLNSARHTVPHAGHTIDAQSSRCCGETEPILPAGGREPPQNSGRIQGTLTSHLQRGPRPTSPPSPPWDSNKCDPRQVAGKNGESRAGHNTVARSVPRSPNSASRPDNTSPPAQPTEWPQSAAGFVLSARTWHREPTREIGNLQQVAEQSSPATTPSWFACASLLADIFILRRISETHQEDLSKDFAGTRPNSEAVISRLAQVADSSVNRLPIAEKWEAGHKDFRPERKSRRKRSFFSVGRLLGGQPAVHS